MRIRYGLIGSGMMGQEHIRNLALLEGCEVTAISDPDANMRALSIAATGGRARGFAEHREMLAARICDAVIIASPNDTHYGILLDVLGSDLPILCEKPLCTTSGDCREILSLAGARASPVWVAMEYRYMPPVQRLLAEIAGGTVGVPRMMSVREHRFPFLEKVGDWNRFNARTGGTLVEKCCHFWDLMRLALGSNPQRVFASAGVDVNHLDETYAGHIPNIVDNAYVVVDFENGTRGMLDLCMFAEGSRWQQVISVTGESARIDAKIPGAARYSPGGRERAAEIEISHRADKTVHREEIPVDPTLLAAGDHHGATYYQHERFRDLIRRGSGQPEVDVLDGLWSVALGEAAEESANTNRAVAVTIQDWSNLEPCRTESR